MTKCHIALRALIGPFRYSDRFLRHAIALVHHCLRHDYVQGALTPGAQELSMQCRQLLDDAAAARARAPMRYRITGADTVDAVAETSTRRRSSTLRGKVRRLPRGRRQRRRPQQDA